MDTQDPLFWEADQFQTTGLGISRVEIPRVLVSGSGDGALQDFVRLATGHRSALEVYELLLASSELNCARHSLPRGNRAYPVAGSHLARRTLQRRQRNLPGPPPQSSGFRYDLPTTPGPVRIKDCVGYVCAGKRLPGKRSPDPGVGLKPARERQRAAAGNLPPGTQGLGRSRMNSMARCC